MLEKHIKSITLPPGKIFSCLPPIKDALGLRMLDVYSHLDTGFSGHLNTGFSGHLDTGFSWFSWVLEQMLGWFPFFFSKLPLHASHVALPN
jgi:hypothetical protein